MVLPTHLLSRQWSRLGLGAACLQRQWLCMRQLNRLCAAARACCRQGGSRCCRMRCSWSDLCCLGHAVSCGCFIGRQAVTAATILQLRRQCWPVLKRSKRIAGSRASQWGHACSKGACAKGCGAGRKAVGLRLCARCQRAQYCRQAMACTWAPCWLGVFSASAALLTLY